MESTSNDTDERLNNRDGHAHDDFSTQPLNSGDGEESIHEDEREQPNTPNNKSVPEIETRLLVFLQDLSTPSISSTDDDVSEHTSIRYDNDTVKTAADVPINTAVSPTDEKADATSSGTAESSAKAADDTTSAGRDLADDDASVAVAGIATTPVDAGLPEYLEETLEDNVNVRSLWFPHSTPLHIAIQKGRVKICERLISAGADINARDDDGVQPLHTACWYGNSDLIRLLLDKKAGTTGPDSDGWCLLHYASFYDLEPALLDRLIEVDREYLNNKERFEGWTPVSRATWFGRESVVDALLKAGVDLDIPDNANRTPMIMAIKEQYFSILDKMVNHLALVGSDDLAERAIDHRDGEGMTVLMTLCAAEPSSASVESLRNFLTKLRPNPDITDNINQTALDHAMIMAKTFNSDHAKNVALEIIRWWPQETLLRSTMAKKTAFDDAFDKESHPLLEAMVNRLKEDGPLRDQLLRWLALREERHATAIDILSELDAHDSIDLLQSKDEWTLVDWAIYHRMPRVLLNCPALDDRGRKRGTEIIEQLKQIYPAQEKKRNTDRKDELTERQVLNAMVGVLNFLPRVPKKYWKISKRTPEMTRCSKHFNAAAVRFHLLDLEALTFQKVDELVYGDSPIKLTTIDQIQQFATGTKTSTESARKSPPTESAFTWIHLPATNMEWMKDTAVKIMRSQSQNEISDQEKLASFLQASWVQIPDKTSPSRFMRPRYVRMQAEDVSVPETNTGQSDHAPEDNVGPPPGPVPQDDKKMNSSNSLHCPASALYMPFLVVGQYDHEKEHTQHDGTHEATSFPRPQSMEQPERAFQRQDLFSAYKTSVLHDSPTLDEHYYHFAEDKDSARDRLDRNETQVITKYLSPGSKVGGKRQKPQKPQTILRVSQLWAWTIGDKWLITSTSCAKVDEKSTFVAEIREHLLRRADDGSLNGGIHSPQELSKVIAEYCIGAYERKQELQKQISEPIRDDQWDPASAKTKVNAGKAAHNQARTRVVVEERSIRQVFSDFINQIGRNETDLFLQFSNQPVEMDEKQAKGKNQPLTLTDVLEATRKAARFLFQIKDVRDELHILKTIAEYQQKVQASMENTIPSVSKAGFDENMKAKYVKNDVEELDRLASNIQEALQTTLTLHESEIANRQAKEAVDQGKRVIIFTVVTVWFLPLSFLTSLFALDVESFLGAPWWSLIVILIVPLPFLLVAVGYMYDWDIKALSFRRDKKGEEHPINSTANKASRKFKRTGGLRRRLTRQTEEYDDWDGRSLV